PDRVVHGPGLGLRVRVERGIERIADGSEAEIDDARPLVDRPADACRLGLDRNRAVGCDDLRHEELRRVGEADDAGRVESAGDLPCDDRAVSLAVEAAAAADEALGLGDLMTLEVRQPAVDARVDDRDLHGIEVRRRRPRVERVVLAQIPLLVVVRVGRRKRSSGGRRNECRRHDAGQRDPQLLHYPTLAAWTRIRTGAAASFRVANRYCVVTFGLTAKWKAPVLAAGTIALSRFHCVPLLRFCTTTPRTPRTTPCNTTRVLGATAGFGDGSCSERTPTLNHVERSPRADATVVPLTVAVR